MSQTKAQLVSGLSINASAPATAFNIDASGRVGIGTTSPSTSLEVVGSSNQIKSGDGTATSFLAGSNSLGGQTGTISNHAFLFYTNSSERARIDTSGRLLVGTSSARSNVNHRGTTGITPTVQFETATASYNGGLSIINNSSAGYAATLTLGVSHGTTIGSNTIGSTGSQTGTISFSSSDGTNFIDCAQIRAEIDATPGANDMPGRLVFSTTADGASSPTERMRIANNGVWSGFSDVVFNFRSAQAASASNAGIDLVHSATNISNGTLSFRVWTNGNVVNTNSSYGAISDIKLKENIVDANSQWSDIKALRIRNYNFKPETGHETHKQLGLIAQEAELVSPGLVSASLDRDEDGNETGEVTKSVAYSVLYMKAVKALQEAMERIEQLETEMAAVKAQLS